MGMVSLTHANDIDGLGSSALIRMKFGIPLGRMFFTDYSKEGVGHALSRIDGIVSKEDGTTLFITDLGMDRAHVKAYASIIRKVRRKGGKVVWFDHHVWDGHSVKNVAKLCDVAVVGENGRYCAAEITMRNLGVSGRFARRFAGIVHHSDFNLRPRSMRDYRLIGTYAMSIMLYNSMEPYDRRDRALRHVVGVIASGRLADSRMVRDAARFEKGNRTRTAKMLKKLYEAGSGAYVGFSENLQSTSACGAIMDKTGCDLGIYVNVAKGTAHLRSREFDTLKLSAPLGGGGHPHASGFPIDMKRFNGLKAEKDRKRFAEFVSKRIRMAH